MSTLWSSGDRSPGESLPQSSTAAPSVTLAAVQRLTRRCRSWVANIAPDISRISARMAASREPAKKLSPIREVLEHKLATGKITYEEFVHITQIQPPEIDNTQESHSTSIFSGPNDKDAFAEILLRLSKSVTQLFTLWPRGGAQNQSAITEDISIDELMSENPELLEVMQRARAALNAELIELSQQERIIAIEAFETVNFPEPTPEEQVATWSGDDGFSKKMRLHGFENSNGKRLTSRMLPPVLDLFKSILPHAPSGLECAEQLSSGRTVLPSFIESPFGSRVDYDRWITAGARFDEKQCFSKRR